MLTWVQSIPSNVVLCGLAAIAATVFGVAALWAVGGRAGWLARTAPVALLLAALVPIGAYELLAVFGAQVAIVIAWALTVRFGRAFHECRKRGESRHDALRTALRRQLGERARFHLRDVLLAVLLAGVVLAIVRFADPMRTEWLWAALPPRWDTFVAAGAILGLATVTAQWTIFGRVRWYYRVLALILVSVALSGWLYWGLGVSGMAGVACSVMIVTFSGLTRLACWAPGQQTTDREQRIPPTRYENSTRPWTRRLSQATLCAAALATGTILIPVYWVLLPAKPPAAIALPSPNGYDELVRAAKSLNWSAIPSQNSDLASVVACRRFVQENAATLTLVREALTKPSRVPNINDPTSPANNLGNIVSLRDLLWALNVEAKLAVAEGRHADALTSYLDMVQLGDSASLSGLLLHDSIGSAFRAVGLGGIELLVPQLAAAELSMVCQRLEKSAAKQEPIEPLIARDEALASVNYGWLFRLYIVVEDSFWAASVIAVADRNQDNVYLRLILAEAALRRYVLQHGSPPKSLAALVPGYLSAVPQDPYGDGPLVYRTTNDGYLLYSVGSNGTDDGGQRVSFVDAIFTGNGDLFFGVPQETPEEDDATEESAGE